MATRPTVLACLWLAVAVVTAAQDSPSSNPQQPTFRTGTQSVRVDLYVTRDGEPITDLRRDEVQVFEDGVPQAIQAFEHITFAGPRSGPVVEPKTPEHSRQLATDPRSRLFVLFLTSPDITPVAGQRVQRQAALIRMLNELFGPDDVVAVMTPYMRIEDLNFQRRLPQSDDGWFRDLKADPKQSLWDACYPPGMGSPINEMKARYRELMTFEALEALVTHLGGLRDERKHILVMSDGFRLYTRNPALPARGRPDSGGLPIGGGGGGGLGVAPRLGDGAVSSSGRVPFECQQDLKDLASLDNIGRLGEIATYATRTNVSFYPISPQQLTGPMRVERFRGAFENSTQRAMQASLRSLAEDTDGIPIVSTDKVQDILRRIMATTSSYYLLGYTPANTTVDGRFRRISVKVSRPDTSVHARSGYVAGLTEERPVAPVETRKPPEPIDISIRALNVSRTSVVHLRSAAWTRSSSSGSPAAMLWIVGELDAQRRQGSWSKGGTAEITLRPLNGGAAISRQVSATGADSTFEFALRESDGPLAPGEYSVQLQLTGADDKPVGEFARVTVPDAASSLGEAVLLRRGATTGGRYANTGDPRFRRTDRLRLELPTDAAGQPSAVLRDTRGAALSVPLQISDRPDTSGAFRWILVDVPLLSLAPADYAVEVTQGGQTRLTAFRLTP